jgi:hypothetical protein
LPEPKSIIQLTTFEPGELTIITISSTAPIINESMLWEVESVRIDFMSSKTHIYADNLKLKIAEYLNISASENNVRVYDLLTNDKNEHGN